MTAVIPTALTRPELLERALASVRRQRDVTVEIVVVADVEPGTPLPDLGSDVVVVALDGPVGPSAARNAGARAAHGEWVAFLDDDDAWAPDKLRRQLEVAVAHGPDVVVSSKFNMVIGGEHRGVLPRFDPTAEEDLSTFAFCRRLPYGTVGSFVTSTLLTSTSLVQRCGFSADLPWMQEIDWALRATKRHGARFVQLGVPLTDWHVDPGRPHVSGARSWLTIVQWVDANRDLLTPSSAAGALLLSTARTPDACRHFASVVKAAFERGRPRPIDLIASAYACVIPRRWRIRAAGAWASLLRRRSGS